MGSRFRAVLGVLALILSRAAAGPAAQDAGRAASPSLDARFQKMSAHPRWSKPGAQEVLRTAYETLKEGRAKGQWPSVGLEDLATHALQEGSVLFERPAERRWGATSAAETKDFIGQTTVGPWQMTTDNIRGRYGAKYGVQRDWSPAQVVEFCARNPKAQAGMILDFIEGNYGRYGRRGPYAVQAYFWLQPFLKGESGQGPWDASVLTRPMKDSGFYAKQVLCGVSHQVHGLLYWLAVNEAWDEILEVAAAWRNQRKLDAAGRATQEPGGFELKPEDLKYMPDATIRERIARCLRPPGAGREAAPGGPPALVPGLTLDRGAVIRGPRDRRRLALVFTGGSYADGAPRILDDLRARGIRASFFFTGDFLRTPAFRKVVDRVREEGHYLGPHSDRHPQYASWDSPPKLLVGRKEFDDDLSANLETMKSIGFPPEKARFFLPPFEHHTPEVAEWTRARGMVLVNLTPGTRSPADCMEDDDPRFVPAAEIEGSILDREKSGPDGLRGFLLLMHVGASPKRTRDRLHDRLGGLLDEIARRGYEFARVDELLSAAKP